MLTCVDKGRGNLGGILWRGTRYYDWVLSGVVVFEHESFIRGRISSKLGRYKVIV